MNGANWCKKIKLSTVSNIEKIFEVFKILAFIMCSARILSHFSHVWLFATLRTITCQAPLSMEFSRKGYWTALPCPPPGDLLHPGIQPVYLTSLALAGRFFLTSTTSEVWYVLVKSFNFEDNGEFWSIFRDKYKNINFGFH